MLSGLNKKKKTKAKAKGGKKKAEEKETKDLEFSAFHNSANGP